MQDYILLSTLNDFIFCPYSIYLHNVFMGGDESITHAVPQTRGKIVHKSVDEKTYSTRREVFAGLPVYCSELGITGKIDIYKMSEQLLVERKYSMNTVYRGQIYQLWGQYFCLIEMGFSVQKLAFYVVSTNKMIPVDLPGEKGKHELIVFIERFKDYNPDISFIPNTNKCSHCIYSAMCDKTKWDHVYA